MQPLVSIYLPTHNRADLLARAARSVLTQRYQHIELLIVDDGSTDGTAETISRLAQEDHRVRALRHAEPRGAPSARNLAICAAKGDLITGIDDDDEMLPQHIVSLVAAFDHRYSLICSGFVRKTKTGSRIIAKSRKVISLDEQLMRNHVGNAALTLRTRLLEVGLFDESMPAWQDYDLWTRLITRFGSALRIAAADHVVHLDHNSPRISRRTLEGAERFMTKHSSLMSDKHKISQELEIFMLRSNPMSSADLIRLGRSPNLLRSLRYFVTSNASWLRDIRDQIS
ncbi:MAG: glycosyltransferase [Gammaproteobacteria bacterium]|nr:glycosyltransferase [Gammaproteobacteria bacterium]